MTIYIFGNELSKSDNKPYKMVSQLKKEFKSLVFEEKDPNENFIPESGAVIIDTVKGISQVTVFDSMEYFLGHSMISPHDYDLGFHLALLHKLGKLDNVQIIGIPEKISSALAYKGVKSILYEIIKH
jgi:hypothetical protein